MIDDPHFSLDPGPGWRSQAIREPGQYGFRDEARGIMLTLSAMPLAAAPDTVGPIAAVLVEQRAKAEADAARAVGRVATIYEAIVVPRSWGRAVAYYGHDANGRQFGYAGLITRRAAISLYMSSTMLSERALMEAMDEVGSRIVFDRTPLDTSLSAGLAPA